MSSTERALVLSGLWTPWSIPSTTGSRHERCMIRRIQSSGYVESVHGVPAVRRPSSYLLSPDVPVCNGWIYLRISPPGVMSLFPCCSC